MKKLLIIGYGNFGKLLAKQLDDLFEVFVTDKNKIDTGDFTKVLDSENIEKDLVAEMEIIIFAVPVQFLQEAVDKWKEYISLKTVILDVSSVKVFPLNILRKAFPENRLIGTHPLFGPESVSKKIENLKVVVSNVSGLDDDLKFLEKIIHKLNYQVVKMTPNEHDREIAEVQVLSHFIGFALRDFKLQKNAKLKTLAYRRMYDLYENILNDSEELFFTIQNYNPYAKEMRQRLIDRLIELDKKSSFSGEIGDEL